MPDLYTFGEAMALFLSEDTDSVIDAKLYRRSTAGAEGNVAVAVSRLGLHAHFYTHLGADELGTAILDDFIAEGVDVSEVKRVPEFSGTMIRNPGTTRPVEATYLRKGAAATTISPTDINLGMLHSSKWVHATGITCAISTSAASAVEFALTKARAAKIACSLDLNIRRKLWSEAQARVVLEPLAHDLDLLIGGEDEYLAIFGENDPKRALELVADRGCKIAIMTKGDQKIRYLINGEFGEVTPPKVKAVDPVGSGDAFTGGVIAGLLSGLSTVDAIKQGSVSGARVASQFGDWAGLPTGVKGRTDPAIIAQLTGGAQ
ncbi:MAG: sugar kinase [Actinobacteria bacterium]|nr:sugar kinase [Actinomycetota bacterium]